MKKHVFVVVLFLSSFFCAFAQFVPNTIGVCYLKKETSDKYFFSIAIPNGNWDTICHRPGFEFKPVADTFIYTGKIALFDSNGEIYRFDNKEKFLMQAWCENDGGMHYQPTLDISIEKKKIKRQIKAVKEIDSICCFVLVNGNDKFKNVNVRKLKNVKLKGDYNHDGQIDCFIWTSFSEDTQCGDDGNRKYSIWLNVGEFDFEISCCGP